MTRKDLENAQKWGTMIRLHEKWIENDKDFFAALNWWSGLTGGCDLYQVIEQNTSSEK